MHPNASAEETNDKINSYSNPYWEENLGSRKLLTEGGLHGPK